MSEKDLQRSAGENQKSREELERTRKANEQSDLDLPGYPHYDKKEDITVQAKREPLDVENVSRSGGNKKKSSELNTGPELEESGEPHPVPDHS